MALTRRKRYHNQTMRRSKMGPSTSAQSPPTPNATVTSITHAGSTLVVVFPQPMIFSGILPKWTNNGVTVIGVTVNSPTNFTVTFSAATAATPTVIPYEDPSFRTLSGGGYIQPGSYTTA